MDIITDILVSLNINNYSEQFAVMIFAAAAAAVIILRFIINSGYESHGAVFRMQANRIKISSKSDLEGFKRGAIAKALREYVKLSNAGVVTNAPALAERELNRSRLMFLSYSSLEKLVESLETAQPVAAIMMAVVFEAKSGVIVVGAVLFGLMKLFAAMFDFRAVRTRLVDYAAAFIEYEAGRFYPQNMSDSLNLLRAETTSALREISGTLTGTLSEFGSSLRDMTQKTMQASSDSVNELLNRFAVSGESLKNWETAVEKAAAVQTAVNDSYSQFKGMVEPFKEAVAEFKAANGELNLKAETINEELAVLRENQNRAVKVNEDLETLLQNLSQSIGDTVSQIVNFHTQEAYSRLGAELQDHIRQSFAANAELITRMTEIFDRMKDQSRTEAAAIVSLKEQLDISLDMFRHQGGEQGK